MSMDILPFYVDCTFISFRKYALYLLVFREKYSIYYSMKFSLFPSYYNENYSVFYLNIIKQTYLPAEYLQP